MAFVESVSTRCRRRPVVYQKLLLPVAKVNIQILKSLPGRLLSDLTLSPLLVSTTENSVA